MYPIGEDDSEAGLKEDEDGYQGRSVNVKAGGKEATFTIHGIQAQELFDGMKQKEEPARIRDGKLSPVEKSETVDNTRKGEQEGTTVFVKKGIHVICFRATFTLAPVTECVVTLEPKPGKAKPSDQSALYEDWTNKSSNDPANPQDGSSVKPSVPPTPAGSDGTSGGSTPAPNPEDGGSDDPSVTPSTPGGDGTSGGSTPTPNPQDGGSGEPSVPPTPPGGDGTPSGSTPAPNPQDGGSGDPSVTPTPPGGDGTSDGDKTPKKE